MHEDRGLLRELIGDGRPALSLTAVALDFVEGYVNPIHLAPAFAGAALFGVSIGLEIIASRTAKSSGLTAAEAVERRVVG